MAITEIGAIRMPWFRPLLHAVVALVASSLPTTQAGSNRTLKAAFRNNYQEVNTLVQQSQLSAKLRRRLGAYAEVSLVTDRSGVIRRYVLTTGSDDSPLSVQHDYDRNGNLTFVPATYGNVAG